VSSERERRENVRLSPEEGHSLSIPHRLSIPHPSFVAVVSGKGGVGKTIISANFARLSATVQRTLLLDFDFPNQGLTGLLSDFLRPGCLSARELIQSVQTFDLERVINIRQNLLFIPAFDPADLDRFTFNPNRIDVLELAEILVTRMSTLIQAYSLDLVIMDCHGGLDHISYASFETSHRTIVVSEPDLVTFNGTLELFDYYVENYTSANPSGNDGGLPVDHVHHSQFLESRQNSVILLLNRMSGRFSYNQLLSAYRRKLSATFPLIESMIREYVTIPADSLLARSFSEYPFYLELLPESIFAQKLSLMYRNMFEQSPKIPGRSLLYYIFERKRKKVLAKYLKSDNERRSQAVFAFTSAIQFGLLLVVITMGYIGATTASITAKMSQMDITQTMMQEHPWIFKGGNVAIGIVFIGAAYINFLIAQYYRDNLRYEYRLFRRGARRVAVTRAYPVVPGGPICCIVALQPATRGRREGACGGKGTLSERIPGELFGRDELRRVLV
jgi:MinD-like ATPase involved in chromosome partitioning or flagellar assembly